MLLKGIRVSSLLITLLICFLSGNFEGLRWLWVLPLTFVGIEALLIALAFGFLCLACRAVDITVPQEHDSPFYRRLMNLYAEGAFDLLQTRLHTEGLEKIPTSGRFLVVSNHLDIMDPVLLARFFPNSQLAFISKKENADMFLVGKVMHKTMCQMIDRENDRAALRTIINCIRLIKEDECSVAVFPEGYTSMDVKLHHFRCGVFKIAIKANVPIVVCTLQNTQNILRSAARLKPVDAHLHVLGVIQPEEFAGKTAIQIGERVYDWMLSDLGPEYAPEEEASQAVNT